MKPLKMQSDGELKLDVVTGSTEERFEEPLSPNAVNYVRAENSLHIIVTMGFNCPINLDSFRTQLPLALNHPRFSSLIVGDVERNEELKWVQTHVNIDDHIIVPSIDPSLRNNRLAGDKFVEDYLHGLTKTSIDYTSKPPWEFHLLDVKTSEAESIWILRIHHALGDGISITSHVLAWTRQVSNPESLPTLATMRKNKKEENVEVDNKRLWKLPLSIILAVCWWLQVFWNTIVGVSKFFGTLCFLKDSDFLVKANPETDVKRRRVVYTTISLDDMKSIKNAMNVTINDVAIGIIEAGFSRYLNRRFDNGILEKVRLSMGMAVKLRPLVGIQDLNDIKNKDTKLGMANETGFVVMPPLSFRLRDDPLEYVRTAKATIDRKKCSFEAKANINLIKLAGILFGSKVASLCMLKVFSRVSIAVSNVPGPKEEVSFFGHPMKFLAPTVYGIQIPIVIHLQSCTNKMSIVLSILEDVIIDPHELLDDIKESFLQIRAAIMK